MRFARGGGAARLGGGARTSAAFDEHAGSASSDEFWYDNAGNRVRDQRWELSYEAGKLVSKQSGACQLRYRYNLNGDQTEQYWDGAPCGDTRRVSTYDPAGRMTRMETYPAVCGTNQEPCYQPRTVWYDGLGRRILMEADSASSATSSGERGLWRYWWVDDNVLVKTFNIPNDPEVDWTWPEIRRVSGDTLRTVGEWFFYAPGADNILGSINPLLAQGRRHMFVKDYRGSVIQTTYEDGQALGIGADWYQPFGGQDAGSTARATEPGYNGHESSGGLVYMRNRWYDPNTGRFTQEDPIGLAGGMNLYGFANGDPVNFSDPFGLWPLGKILKLTVAGAKTLMKGADEAAMVRNLAEGEDVIVGSQQAASRIARAAGGGKRPVGPEANKLPGGGQGRPHYHPAGRKGGHVFYSIASGLTLSKYAEGRGTLVEGAAAVGDFFNPLSIAKDAIDIYDMVKPAEKKP